MCIVRPDIVAILIVYQLLLSFHSPGGSTSWADSSDLSRTFAVHGNDVSIAEPTDSAGPGRSSSAGDPGQPTPAPGFICPDCSKSFKSAVKLQRHLASNHGNAEERRFRCEHCRKAFKYKHHRKEHENTHFGVKPFQCPRCHKRFGHSGSFSSHKTSGRCFAGNAKDFPPRDQVEDAVKANGKNGYDWLPFVQGFYLDDLAHLSVYQQWEYYKYLSYSQCMVNGLNPPLQHLIQRNMESIPGRMNYPAQFVGYPPESGKVTELPGSELVVEENSSSLDMVKSLDENDNNKIVTKAVEKNKIMNGRSEFSLNFNEGHRRNDSKDKSGRCYDSNDFGERKVSDEGDRVVTNGSSGPLNQLQSAKVEFESGVDAVQKMEELSDEDVSRSSSASSLSGAPGVKWSAENGRLNPPDALQEANTKELKDKKYDCLKGVEAYTVTPTQSKADDDGCGTPLSSKSRSEGVLLTTSPNGSCSATRIKTDSPAAAGMSSETLERHGTAERMEVSNTGLTNHFKTEIPDHWSASNGTNRSLANLSRSIFTNGSPGSTMLDAQEQPPSEAASPPSSPFLSLPGIHASAVSPSSLLLQTSSSSCVVPSSWHSFPYSSMASTSGTIAASSPHHPQAFLSPFPSSMICRFCNNCFQSPIELYDHESRCPEIKTKVAQAFDIPSASLPRGQYRSPVHEIPMISETGLQRENTKAKRKAEPLIDAGDQPPSKSFYHETSSSSSTRPSAEDLERLRLSLGFPVGAPQMCFQKMRLHERKVSGGFTSTPPRGPVLSPRPVNAGGLLPFLVEHWQNMLAVGALQREKLQSGGRVIGPKSERTGNEGAAEGVGQVEPLDLSLRKDDAVDNGAVDLRVRERPAVSRRGFPENDSAGTPDSIQNVPDWNIADNAHRLLASASKRREVGVGYAGSELGNFRLQRMLPFVNGFRNSHKPGGEYFQVRIISSAL